MIPHVGAGPHRACPVCCSPVNKLRPESATPTFSGHTPYTRSLTHAISGCLLLVDDRRTADFALEVHTHLYAVSDFNERYAAVHPELLTVEGHRPCNRA
jgi:hypothetical protein